MFNWVKWKVWRLVYRHTGYCGQFTMYALLMTFLSIVVYSVLYPVLQTVFDTFLPDDMPELDRLIIELSPLFLFLFILYSAMWYVVPHREQYPPGGGDYGGE